MNFPVINTRTTGTVNVPELCGGINRRDAVYSINDNQMTYCKNMWFKKGSLITRPGYNVKALCESGIDESYSANAWDIYDTVDGEFCRLVSYSGSNETRLFYIGDSGVKTELPIFEKKLSGFIVSKGKSIYIFSGNVYKLNGEVWEALTFTSPEIYIPTVMTNCLPNGSLGSFTIEGLLSFGAATVEGYNLLTPYYKMVYSTVNRELLEDKEAAHTGNESYTATHPMIYTLPESVYGAKYEGDTVTAVITDNNGTEHTHTVTIGTNVQNYEADFGDDGLKMLVQGKQVIFKNTNDGIEWVDKNDFIRNNLTITAPFRDDSFNEKRDYIFTMRRAVWYGGYKGLNGGTRLFIGGSDLNETNNLIMRSGLNDPLYFPEDCDIRIGDSNQAVTGFAKQNENLIIFKEHEIYSSEYVFNSDITADDLETSSVYNYESQSVYFPIVQIHSSIGCRIPDSIELCRNRLVWADTDGKVYSLVSGSQYNERNVYELSGMIEHDLKREELDGAYSCDYEGHYILFCKARAYVMDYNSYGYTHCYSYSKTEDSQKLIPWYIWEFNTDVSGFTVGGRLAAVKGNNVFLFEEDVYTDGGEPILSACETKCFDFGTPHIAKNILLVTAGIGNSNEAVRVTYVTEKETKNTDSVLPANAPADFFTAEFIRRIVMRPNIRFANLFGLRFESDGCMSIGKITINYKLTGVKRN